MNVRNPLARYAHIGQEPDRDRARRMCRSAWQDDGLICISLDDIPGWANRVAVEQVIEKVYGKRKGRG